MKYNSFIFDCYGTLYKFGDMKKAWDNWINTFHLFLSNRGYNIEIDYLKKEIDGFFSLPAPYVDGTEFTIYERRLFNKLESINIHLGQKEISGLADETIRAWHDEVKIAEETVEILKELRKSNRLVLLSNFDHPKHVYNLLKEDNIINFFEIVIISGEVGCEKPNPEIFNIALSKLGEKKENVVYIGDSEEDFLGSRNSGIDFYLINRNRESTTKLSTDYKQDITQLEADWTSKYDGQINRITSLSELLKLAG